MTDLLKFDFCEILIYDDHLIVNIDAGITIQKKHNDILVNVAETYFHKMDFVYISHRKNSYAVDPSTYIHTSKIENLKGFAVVSHDFKAKANVEIEKLFLEKPIATFDQLDDALLWVKTILNS